MTTYKEAEKALENVVSYLKETEDVWNSMMNLKLYDAFFEAEEICKDYPLVMQDNGTDWREEFYHFCEFEYDCFMEVMKADGIKDCRKYIGRTSSFYLTDINDKNMVNVIYKLFSETFGWVFIELKQEDGKIVFDPVFMEEVMQPELEYIASGEFLTDAKDFLKDAIWIHDYIKTFKENQVDCFREFMDSSQEIIEDNLRLEAEEEAKIQEATMACYI